MQGTTIALVTSEDSHMASPSDMVSGLTRIAGEALLLALIWHAVIGLAILALLVGWRPSRRVASLLLTSPISSAAMVALASGNVFDWFVLALVAVLLLVLGWRLGDEPVERRPGFATVTGIAVIAFGWAYPHFLEGHSALAYLYAAPTGLLPCPSLSLVIGFAILGDGLGSRPWSLTLAATGIFYGAFGALYLGVWLDLTLLAASLALIAVAFARRRRTSIHWKLV